MSSFSIEGVVGSAIGEPNAEVESLECDDFIRINFGEVKAVPSGVILVELSSSTSVDKERTAFRAEVLGEGSRPS